MRHLARVFGFIWRAQRAALWRGIILSIVVLLAGVALLGLSGWFVVAAGAAGLVSLGNVFDVFRPSAGIRFLALGRTAARYGERLLTHDAVLRGLATLRVRLLAGFSRTSFERMSRLRGAEVLNRITADVDALDGVALRLVIPLVAALIALAVAFGMLWALVDMRVALWTVLGLAVGALLVLWVFGPRSLGPARRAERALQALRVRTIDLLRGQSALTISGVLDQAQAHALAADRRQRSAQIEVARFERRSGFAVSVVATLIAAGALYIGAELARSGQITPAFAALGFFTALALFETVAPLARGIAEAGRMRDAARRIAPRLIKDSGQESTGQSAETRIIPASLQVDGVQVTRLHSDAVLAHNVSFSVGASEILGLTGRSGSGKSTFLAMVAGLIPVSTGRVLLGGQELAGWPEQSLRQQLGFLPQRSALLRGSIAEALRLAAPEADNEKLWAVLDAVALRDVVAQLGGLDARLGEAGAGLSGGEQRRLALARVIIRRPGVLLLDEPTEGLDRETAERVLDRVRQWLPETAIIVASHRAAETAWCDSVFHFHKRDI